MSETSQVQSFGDIRVDGQNNTLTINQIIQIAVAEIKTRPFNPSSPYIGLSRFEERNKDFFFGRDQLIAELLKRVAEKSLTMVAGASGSGKSSVIRAGLLPQLTRRLPQGLFRPLVMTPDGDPFESLRAALIAAGFSRRQADAIPLGSADALLTAINTMCPPGELWLLFIDQFEEIFTICNDEVVRAAFLDAIVKFAHAAPAHARMMLAIRSDFFDRFGPYPELGKLTEQGLCLVTDMPASALRQCIEQPAAHQGVVFEDGLVEQIIADVRGRPGTLPLLQYTLDLLWREDDPREDRTLNTTTYHRLGGVEGALKLHAEALYKKVEEQQQVMMRHIFLRLIDLAGQESDARVVSKRARLSEFELPEERQLIDELVDEKMLISSGTSSGSGTVEIAHEALLSAWPTLQKWIGEAREVIYLRNRLRGDAEQWQRVKSETPDRADNELWSGLRLQRAWTMHKQQEFQVLLGGLTAEEQQFLTASESQQEKKDPTKAQNERIFAAIVVSVVLTILIINRAPRIGTAWLSWSQMSAGDRLIDFEILYACLLIGIVIFRKRLLSNTFHRDVVVIGFITWTQLFALRWLGFRIGLSPAAIATIDLMVAGGGAAWLAYHRLPWVWIAVALVSVSSIYLVMFPKNGMPVYAFASSAVIFITMISWVRAGGGGRAIAAKRKRE